MFVCFFSPLDITSVTTEALPKRNISTGWCSAPFFQGNIQLLIFDVICGWKNQKPLKFLPVWESAKEKMVTASGEENWESLSNGPATDPGLIRTHHNYRPDFSDQIFRVSVIYEHISWCLSDGPYRWLSSWNISSQIKLGDASLSAGTFLEVMLHCGPLQLRPRVTRGKTDGLRSRHVRTLKHLCFTALFYALHIRFRSVLNAWFPSGSQHAKGVSL